MEQYAAVLVRTKNPYRFYRLRAPVTGRVFDDILPMAMGVTAEQMEIINYTWRTRLRPGGGEVFYKWLSVVHILA